MEGAAPGTGSGQRARESRLRTVARRRGYAVVAFRPPPGTAGGTYVLVELGRNRILGERLTLDGLEAQLTT